MSTTPETPDFDKALFDALFEKAIAEHHPAGSVIFMQDDVSDRLYGILEGKVEISHYSEGGRKLVANIQTGPSLLGEVGALDGGLRTATATCATDCSLVSIPRHSLFAVLRKNPDAAVAMIDMLCSRIRWISSEFGDQALLNIETRLAKRLLLLSDRLADGDGWVRSSQNELAEFLGATRESVNKTLKEWQRDGVVASRRGAVKVLRKDALRAIAAAVDE